MSGLDIKNISFSYSNRDVKNTVFDDFDLKVEPQSFCAIVGPSGCGKSTLLRAITGLSPISGGSIRWNNAPVASLQSDFGMVFQRPALLPWLSVRGNIQFALELGNLPRSSWDERTEEVLLAVELADSADLYPFELSGGMAQRVSIARCLANKPSVLLLDEPFSALDYPLRLSLQAKFRELHNEFMTTTIFVTHFLEEAVSLADRVIVLSNAPAKIRKEVVINMDFPRRRADEAFRNYESELAEALGLENF